MLYPLSYWSFLIVAPPSWGMQDSRIIAAAISGLKRRRKANIVQRHSQRKPTVPKSLG